MDNVERSLSTSKNTCRGTRALKEKGRGEKGRGEKGSEQADIFSGSKVGPVAILPRVFFPKIYACPPPV